MGGRQAPPPAIHQARGPGDPPPVRHRRGAGATHPKVIMTIEHILGSFRSAPRRIGQDWMARCPAHDDREPSRSVSVGRDGRILMSCFAGCDIEAICQTLGTSMRDLMPSDPRRRVPRIQSPRPAAGQAPLTCQSWSDDRSDRAESAQEPDLMSAGRPIRFRKYAGGPRIGKQHNKE